MAEEPTKKPKRRAERIGKYEILERIACGGMGIVYKARDPDLERLVALKILPPDMAKQETTLIRFQREGKAAARLRHENIVSIYEIGEYNGAHFIALEYIDGKDLQAYISRQCRLDPNEARLLMIQAARALAHAHEHGIVHRDIKPSNFLLVTKNKDTVLKLTDFGLAIQHENEDEFRLTKDKTTVGTVDYMSPEQARDSRSADIRSDIYSLGCTFYHMLSGTAPFAKGTLTERIVQHMRTPPPDVRKLNESVPKSLGAIIHRMLAKKPADRYQTPMDLLFDLENLQAVALPDKDAGTAKRGRFISRKSIKADVTSVIEKEELEEASAEPAQVKFARAKRKPPPDEDEDYEEPESAEEPAPPVKFSRVKGKPPPDEDEDYDEPDDAEEPAPPPVKFSRVKGKPPPDEDQDEDYQEPESAEETAPPVKFSRVKGKPLPHEDQDYAEPDDADEPAPVKFSRVKGKRLPDDDEDDEPAQVKSRAKRKPSTGDDEEESDSAEEPARAPVKFSRGKRKPSPDDDEAAGTGKSVGEEPKSAVVEKEDDDEEASEDTMAERGRAKASSAGGSPLWMYAAAGTVALMGLILVLAFASGPRTPPTRKEDPDKKAAAPPPVVVVVPTDPKIAPPEPMPMPPMPMPPMTVVEVDTSPDKMTVAAPPLPRMDFDPAKADTAALRKEFFGPFEAFPTMPEKAHRVQVRRLNVAGSPSFSSLAEALAQTKTDQFNVIEISDNGPIFVSTLPAVAKRTILLCGAEGYRPLLVWDLPKKPADAKTTASSFLEVSGGRLILENLDFVLHAAAKPPSTIFDLPESDFFARDCTFSVSGKSPQGISLVRRVNPKPLGVQPTKTQTWLRHCYLRGTDASFLHLHESPADVLIDESLLATYQHPLVSVRAKDEDLLTLHCVRSTLVTGQVLLRWQAADGKRLNPYFQGRILDSILSRDDPTAPQGDLLQLKDAGDTNRMNWRASNSVYVGWKQLLASSTKNIAGHELDDWHRHWAYSLSDRVVGEAWPSSPPSGLDELSANAFYSRDTLVAYSALTSAGPIGSIIGRLPAAPENWRERTLEPRQTPIFANIENEPPAINPAADGKYHGERLNLNRVDLGAYLTATLQKTPPAPRVVMHLTGKGVCSTSPLRVNGVQHLVLYFEPTKDPPILEVNPTSFKQRGPLIEMNGGHLEMIGARIRLSLVTLIPTLIHVQDGNVTLSRCWLAGPLTKTADSFQSLVTIANSQPTPTVLLLRENALLSSKLLIHAKDNVQIKARNNALVSLGDGILFDAATPTDSLQHVFDRNTWAVRQSFLQLRAGPEATPKGTVLLLASNNAFLRPFDGPADQAALTRGFDAWTAAGRWTWQGRYNLYDARVPAFHIAGSAKIVAAKQTLKDWQRVWGQVGEHESQVLATSMATRELGLEGLTAAPAFSQLDRLALPRQLRVDAAQGMPGADLFAVGLTKKKG